RGQRRSVGGPEGLEDLGPVQRVLCRVQLARAIERRAGLAAAAQRDQDAPLPDPAADEARVRLQEPFVLAELVLERPRGGGRGRCGRLLLGGALPAGEEVLRDPLVLARESGDLLLGGHALPANRAPGRAPPEERPAVRTEEQVRLRDGRRVDRGGLLEPLRKVLRAAHPTGGLPGVQERSAAGADLRLAVTGLEEFLDRRPALGRGLLALVEHDPAERARARALADEGAALRAPVQYP